jgi:hypothetical protein
MATKQNLGNKAPDGSDYVTLTDGAGNLGGTVAAVGYPTSTAAGVTVLQSSSGNVAAATATATLTGAASTTAYISGFLVTGAGATAGSVVNGTITGTIGGTMTFAVPVATGVTAANFPIYVDFNPPVPASAANTNIVVSVPSLGAGNTNSAVSAWGYRV